MRFRESSGGAITGNTAKGGRNGLGGGVKLQGSATFIMESGTVYGNAGNLPAGTAASLANSAQGGASLEAYKATAKWGSGGTYTGGESPASGGSIVHIDPDNGVGTDDTLIGVPGK